MHVQLLHFFAYLGRFSEEFASEKVKTDQTLYQISVAKSCVDKRRNQQ